MMFKKSTKWFVLVLLALVAAVTLAACGGNDGNDEPTVSTGSTEELHEAELTADEQTYLDEIAAIDQQIGAKVDEVKEARSMAWPTRGLLFETISDAEVHTTFEAMRESAEALAPPKRFAGRGKLPWH